MRPGALSLPALPPLSLYVHLPWCLRKCPYCDFNSHALRSGDDGPPEARYVDALVARSGGVAALRLGPARAHRLHRRRHAEPVRAGVDRAADRRDPRPAAARARLRDHARGQPGHLRARAVPRLRRGRRDAPVDRRAELRRRQAARPSVASTTRHRRGRPSPKRREAFATFNLDLMYALPGADARRVRARRRDGACLRAAAPVDLSPDDRAQHLLRALPAGAPVDDDLAATMLDRIVERAEAPAWSATRSRRSRAPAIAPATTSTTGSSATTWASAPARTASSASPIASFARCGCATRRPTWPAPRSSGGAGERDARSRAPSCAFEFMLNATAAEGRLRDRDAFASAPACRCRRSNPRSARPSGADWSGATCSASSRPRSASISSTICSSSSCPSRADASAPSRGVVRARQGRAFDAFARVPHLIGELGRQTPLLDWSEAHRPPQCPFSSTPRRTTPQRSASTARSSCCSSRATPCRTGRGRAPRGCRR